VADAETAHWITYGESPQRRDLAPGPHVIGNLHPDESSPKLERLRGEAAELVAHEPPSADALAGLCGAHAASPFDSTCVHAGPYGTRSSTLLWIGAQPALRYARARPARPPTGFDTTAARPGALPSARAGISMRVQS
jgi:hypothetical protein